jgi:hypothetical protein
VSLELAYNFIFFISFFIYWQAITYKLIPDLVIFELLSIIEYEYSAKSILVKLIALITVGLSSCCKYYKSREDIDFFFIIPCFSSFIDP